MGETHFYDRGKYHDGTVEELGLPEGNAVNHAVCFLRWMWERDLVSKMFTEETQALEHYKAGNASFHDVYEWWDRCMVSDMFTDEGNRFAKHYFEFETGEYLNDYCNTLGQEVDSPFKIEYTESNYQRLKPVIDRRYEDWKSSTKA